MAKATRDAYGEALAKLVTENPKVVVLDADLAGATKSGEAKKVCPERYFDMGIAEADMVGTSAGFATSGYIPFCSSFAMFTAGRAWEQIRNSVAYPHLNVKVVGTHAGISTGEDGVSHQAIEDIATMRVIPGMEVFVPCDGAMTKAVVNTIAASGNPTYVRLGRSKVDDVYTEGEEIDIYKVHTLRQGSKVAVFSCGLMTQEALKAADQLKAEGIEVTVADICAIKPIDEQAIVEILKHHEVIFTCEEHNIVGGLGSLIAEISTSSCPRLIHRIGVQDRYAESGTAAALLDKYGLTAPHIADAIKKTL